MQRRGCLGLLFSLSALLVLSSGWWVWNCAPIKNPAIEFGYYGRYHKVQRVISQIPGASIVDSWKHEDIVLEDFGFTVSLQGKEAKRVNFWDGTPIKESGDDEEIRSYVLAELQSPESAVK
ncbi:MAG: hypothetical protein ACKO2G_07925 [Verrucomicrobiales bacterium]